MSHRGEINVFLRRKKGKAQGRMLLTNENVCDIIHNVVFIKLAGMCGLIPPHPLTSFAGMAELADA